MPDSNDKAVLANPEAAEARPAEKPKAKKPRKRGRPAANGQFLVTEDGDELQGPGTYFCGLGEDERPRRICAPLHIDAQVRDIDDAQYSVLVRFTSMGEVEKDYLIPRAKLVNGQSSKVLEELVSMGLETSNCVDINKMLMQYLQTSTDVPKMRLVTVTGWSNPNIGNYFVLADQTIGDGKELDPVYFSGAVKTLLVQAGTVQGWRDGVGKFAVGNPLFMLALGAGFAAPLVRISGLDTGGFHFYGASKTGKTTICDMAAGLFGTPREYRMSWSTTVNALEYASAAHNDLPLVLDEIGLADPRAVDTIVYMLSQGKGKARGKDVGGLREFTKWQCFVLSNGEHDLASYLASGGKQAKAGQLVRLISLPAARPFGAFDQLHGLADGAALSAVMAANAAEHHGAVGLAFLQRLVAAREELPALIREGLRKFVADFVPVDASNQVRHGAHYFALAGLAGVMATDYELTGWEMNAPWEAAGAMFKDWIASRGGAGPEEDRQILRQIRLFFEQHGEARFTRWEKDPPVVDEHLPKTMVRCGFRKTEVAKDPNNATLEVGSETTFYVSPESWRDQIVGTLDLRAVNKLLLARGILLPGNEGRPTRKIRIPGAGNDPVRMYVLSLSALMNYEADSHDGG